MNNMEQKKQTPQVRFKGYADTWEQRKLSELAEKTYGGGTPATSNEVFWNGNIPWIQSSDVVDGKLFGVESRKHITQEGLNNSATQLVPPNSIAIITRVGVGKLAFMPFAYTTSQDFLSLSKLNTEPFFTVYACYKKLQSELNAVQGTSIKGITKDELLAKIIMVPQYAEQKQIGVFLRNLDNFITLHQRKYNKLLNLKKAMLEKMFPQNGSLYPEIRFKGFTDAWEPHKLSNFGKATAGTSIESEFSEQGVYKVISIGSYSEDSIYRDQGIRAVKSDKTVNRILNKGDITMILNDKTASGNIIGRVLLIEKSGVYVYNQRTERIEVDNEYYDSQFIYTMLNAPEIRDKIIKQSQGNTQIYVNWTSVSQTDYLVPQIEEQIKIGEYFKNLDNLITLHQCKLEKLKQIKKSCLEKMFV